MNELQQLAIEPCSRREWEKFKHLHFVKRDPVCVKKTFIIRPDIGCIVYSYPPLSSRMRHEYTNGILNFGSRSEIAKKVNRNVTVLSRIAIRGDLQGHHIATTLVRKTLPLINTPIIEAYTNLFGASKCFQNAGMIRYSTSPDKLWFRIEALFKELNIPKKIIQTDNEIWLMIQKMTPERKEYFLKTAKRFLGTIKLWCKDWSDVKIYKELTTRRDQQPFYYFFRNYDQELRL
jgi:hypothetical protein